VTARRTITGRVVRWARADLLVINRPAGDPDHSEPGVLVYTPDSGTWDFDFWPSEWEDRRDAERAALEAMR